MPNNTKDIFDTYLSDRIIHDWDIHFYYISHLVWNFVVGSVNKHQITNWLIKYSGFVIELE